MSDLGIAYTVRTPDAGLGIMKEISNFHIFSKDSWRLVTTPQLQEMIDEGEIEAPYGWTERYSMDCKKDFLYIVAPKHLMRYSGLTTTPFDKLVNVAAAYENGFLRARAIYQPILPKVLTTYEKLEAAWKIDPATLTRVKAQQILKNLGVTLRWNGVWHEYRVGETGVRDDKKIYHTNDLDDAFGSGLQLAYARYQREENPSRPA